MANPSPSHKFGKGNKHGKGRKVGTKLTPASLREQCAKIIDRSDWLKFVERVMNGQETEYRMTPKGEVVECRPPIMVRLEAGRLMMERFAGKPAQELAHTLPGQGFKRFHLTIIEAGAQTISTNGNGNGKH